jgi:two-component system OmpR family sensor kinase
MKMTAPLPASAQKSLRKFLLACIIFALLAVSCISGVASWMATRGEMYEFYDEHLRNIALVVEAHHNAAPKSGVLYKRPPGLKEHRINSEEDLFVRILGPDKRVLYTSHPSIALPFTRKQGFSDIRYNKLTWRVYARTGDSGDTVEVASVLDYRHEAINDITLGILLPQVLFIPLLGLFVWIIVGRATRTLSTLSESVGRRGERFLQPVSLQEAPAEVLPLVTALNGLLDRLAKTIHALRQFTSDAAHELRTPLTALKIQIAEVEKAEDGVARAEAIERLKEGNERAIALVRQLLTLARVEPDAAETPMAETDLSALVKFSIETFLPMAAAKSIDLGMTRAEPVSVTGNRDTLGILLNNLIDNALRYTPVQGRIDVNTYAEDGKIVLEVSDSGPGVQEEEIPRIFDRFYRGRGNLTQGTGLGLAIVSEIAARHAATIAADRSPELGGLRLRVFFDAVTG